MAKRAKQAKTVVYRSYAAAKRASRSKYGMKTGSIYTKVEKGVGSARMAERAMNVLGFPGEPYRSVISTGIGFLRGGLFGGLVAALVSSNIPEMIMNRNLTNGASAPGQLPGVDYL